MRAVVQRGFGEASRVLTVEDVESPSSTAGLADDEVVVRVDAASLHVGDVYGVHGLPKAMRPVFRAMTPANGVIGTDLSGVVRAVGEGVTGIRPGDEVFGSAKGAFAEFVTAKELDLALRPENVSAEQAAAIGVSAVTALQALRAHGGLRSGQSVLITGASGGVGTFAVQLAKAFGAEVTGVCSTRNVELVRELGADHVVDYTREDVTGLDPVYDLVLDNVGAHSLRDTRRVLRASGTLIPNGSGPPSGWFGGLGRPLRAALVAMVVRQQGRPFVSSATPADLATLTESAACGEIVPVIDRTYPLEQVALAIDHVGGGWTRGTTVLTVDEASEP